MSNFEVDRNLAHFQDDIWSSFFTSFSLDTELLKSYTHDVEKLKEEVKDELAAAVEVKAKMILINTLERLGVSYLFREEIDEQLDRIYNANYDQDTNITHDYDLCTIALHFRILRQHGYHISCEVFNKFKDGSGALKETLLNDLNGILNLYEATFTMVKEDAIRDHAVSFTKTHLKSIAPTLSPPMASPVNRVLAQPLHRSVSRIEARYYISVYEMDNLRNENILRLAKVDFNRVQLLHKEELCQLSRWWKNLILKTPYARDRIVECFLWATAVQFEPEYSLVRVLVAKAAGWITVVDDSYDAYGNYDEVNSFTEAIQRWDIGAVDQVPDYLKPAFNDIILHHRELEKELSKSGTSYAIPYSKEVIKVHVKSYDQEAEWVKKGYLPSFEEYLDCRTKCITKILVAASFAGIGKLATPEAFEWMMAESNEVVYASELIGRLTSDLAGYKVEEQREHLASVVKIYMKQYNVAEQEAIDELNQMVEKAWLTFNEEILRTSAAYKPLVMMILNNTRIFTELYKAYDRFTQPEGLKDLVTSLFINPVLL